MPQVCELIASGKICEVELGANFNPNPSDESINALVEVLNTYSTHSSVAERAGKLFSNTEMRHTSISAGNGNISTTKGDMKKFAFMVENNGMYAGKRVMSAKAAQLMKNLMAGFTCK